ncbi:MAG TPA: pitrilysin family protein [Thermoanaerobaculia bacterium]|nr:pitrilysin family protein [Thermoanaerobaculia bacterium]
MRTTLTTVLLVSAALGAASAGAAPPAKQAGWHIPTEVKKLANGLTVVVSEDHSAPTFGLCLAYRIGFRLEPKGRTGFAHLFEHMMFEGTPVSSKGTLDRVIEGGGGILNGSTRYDYTNYIETAPVSALDAILWLEADRLKTLDFSEKNLDNQREVVKEEIRVNVKNKPYGLFFWTDLAGKAFDKWENAHDGYGSFEDLDAAKIGDVEKFFETYYAPNNAVLAIVGDVTPAEVFAKAEKYFGQIPSRKTPPRPDVSEGPNTAERTLEETDPLARVPAVAVGWKMPARGSKDHAAAAVLADLLVGGDASRFYQGLVKGKELLLQVQGGINWPLDSPWDSDGPSLLTVFALYKPTTSAKAVVAAMNEEVEKVAKGSVPAEELARTKTKMVSDLYSTLELPLNRATSLCLAQMFTGDAGSLNELPAKIEAVTAADVSRVAATYLDAKNRTVVDRKPAPPTAKKAEK